jgi:GTP-binding protein EngB required for normal cell division
MQTTQIKHLLRLSTKRFKAKNVGNNMLEKLKENDMDRHVVCNKRDKRHTHTNIYIYIFHGSKSLPK